MHANCDSFISSMQMYKMQMYNMQMHKMQVYLCLLLTSILRDYGQLISLALFKVERGVETDGAGGVVDTEDTLR